MSKSVWEKLAEMPQEKREKYLKTGKSEEIVTKTAQKSFGSVVYRRRTYQVPLTADFGADPAFADD